MPIPVIAIFDVGKTNKKLFLFDEQYNIVFEKAARFNEIVDEDGDPCENIEALRSSLFESLQEVLEKKAFSIRAINFSTYGASLVYIDENGKVLAPLYNYLKVYPPALHQQFYDTYGGEENFAHQTASPVLGSLNAGLQLYRIRYEQPVLFQQLKYALHLPQYMSFLLTHKACSDITSIGCHTGLWHFSKNNYHDWVDAEQVIEKLAPLHSHEEVITCTYKGQSLLAGIGLHDSSAALIPYLVSFTEPFILISTGTWCISLNPFNHQPLTTAELKQDCLCYLSYKGEPVKASRLFAGYEHEQEVKRLAAHFDTPVAYYREVVYDLLLAKQLVKDKTVDITTDFSATDLGQFASYKEAYHALMYSIAKKQFSATSLVIQDTPVKRLFVDGGFSKNSLYMNFLAEFFPSFEVYAATIAQSTALGTALAMHHAWNTAPFPNDIISLHFYKTQID